MLEKARAALMQPRGNKNFPVFLEGDIAGIGKNYLTVFKTPTLLIRALTVCV
jgi:hypothetical protein